MNRVVVWVGALLLVPLASESAHAQVVSTSPGKKSVYASGNATFTGSVADITATIAKGKPRTVVEIEAWGQVVGCVSSHVGVGVSINGSVAFGTMYVEPTGGGVFRSNSAVWWFDIDAAEATSPGSFVKQPLDILLRASAPCPDGATFSGTLRARLVKK